GSGPQPVGERLQRTREGRSGGDRAWAPPHARNRRRAAGSADVEAGLERERTHAVRLAVLVAGGAVDAGRADGGGDASPFDDAVGGSGASAGNTVGRA